MAFNPKRIANMQARYDRLSSLQNRRPSQQAAMDRIGAKLNPAPSITGNAALDKVAGQKLNPAPAGPGPGLASVIQGVGPNNAPTGTGGFGMPFGGQIGGAASGTPAGMTMKKGGRVKGSATSSKGTTLAPKVSSASKRGDGIAQRGKTKGRYI